MTDKSSNDETKPPGRKSLFEFIDDTCPTAAEDERRQADEADPRDAIAIMVRLDPVVGGLSQDEFYEVFDRGDAVSDFAETIEAYSIGDPERDEAVFRVTGLDPDPKYYRGRDSDVALFFGSESRNNWGFGHLDQTVDAFDDLALEYIEPYLLFDDDGTNRIDEIRRANSVLDAITSPEFRDALNKMSEMSEEELEQVFEDWDEGS